MNYQLDNKVCVITGAAGVLCSQMVKALAAAGASVALIGRTESKLEALAEELRKDNHQVCIAPADVCDRDALLKAKDKINSELGSIDILINGAGGNHPDATTALEEITGDDFEKSESFFGIDANAFQSVFGLNFIGSLLPSIVFGEDMSDKKDGVILNISSMSAYLPLTKVPAYSSAKAAVDNFTKWLAVHVAQRGIRVNALAPGFFVTDQNRFLLYQEDGKTLSARGEKIIQQTPMRRFGEAEELRDATVFLCSDASKFMTGQIVGVDGGFSAFSGV